MHVLHKLMQFTLSAIPMLTYYQFRKVHVPLFVHSQIIVIIYNMSSFQTEVFFKKSIIMYRRIWV